MTKKTQTPPLKIPRAGRAPSGKMGTAATAYLRVPGAKRNYLKPDAKSQYPQMTTSGAIINF